MKQSVTLGQGWRAQSRGVKPTARRPQWAVSVIESAKILAITATEYTDRINYIQIYTYTCAKGSGRMGLKEFQVIVKRKKENKY